jgi:hypothetical protein
MSASSSDPTYWRDRLNTIIKLFNEEKFHDCIAELQVLLRSRELPPLYRIHARALFAAALDDWYEADVCSQPKRRFLLSYFVTLLIHVVKDQRALAENIYEITRGR